MKEKKSKNYVIGAAILMAGTLLTKILGMFFKIPLTNTIGDYGMGLYGYTYPLYTTLLMLSTGGLPSAVSKMVSESVSRNNLKEAYKIFRIAFVTLAVLGFLSSLAMFFGAKAFIRLFNWDENVYYSIIAISLAPLFVCLCSVVRGFFQGMQDMAYTSISQVIEQIARVVVGISLATYLMKTMGAEFASAGATFASVAGAFAGFVYLYISFGLYYSKHKLEFSTQTGNSLSMENNAIFGSLIKIAIPIAISSVVVTQMDLINSLTISKNLTDIGYTTKQATDLYGQLTSKAQTLVNLPLTMGVAISTSLVPSISESFAKKDITKVKSKVTLAVKLSFLLSVPAALGLSILAEPIIKMLYSKAYEGYEMLSILAYSIIFSILMSTLQAVLQGAGKYYIPVRNMLIGGVIKIVLNNLLIKTPRLNIYGAIISTIVATLVIAILNYIAVKKHVGFNKLLASTVKIIAISLVMAVVCKVSYALLVGIMSFKIATLIAIFISIAIYLALIILTKTITLDELRSVRS